MDKKVIKEREVKPEDWANEMVRHLADKNGKVEAKKLVSVLMQIKERLDAQYIDNGTAMDASMNAAIVTAALCDLLIAKGVITEKELDKATLEIEKKMAPAE